MTVPSRMEFAVKWARGTMNMAIQGPILPSVPKDCRMETFSCTSGLTRSRVVRNVITKQTTQINAHRPMVICQPLALLPCPNLATSGSVKPPTINCAIIAATKRYDDKLVRSLTSGVMTAVMAEEGVLLGGE